jgi:hypothetical protein
VSHRVTKVPESLDPEVLAGCESGTAAMLQHGPTGRASPGTRGRGGLRGQGGQESQRN